MNSAKKNTLLAWFWRFAAMVVVSFFTTFGVLALVEWRKPPAAEPVANYRESGSDLGINCHDGKAFITTRKSGGFLTTSAVVVDGQFVECGMTYKVNGQEISALDALQHAMSN